MKIGIVGYFGYGNYGDELFLEAYRKYFYDCDITVLSKNPPISADATKFIDDPSKVDRIIIGGGDLFIPKYFASEYFDDDFLTKPVYFHGVGVPLWIGEDADVVQRMARFVQHPNVRRINVRDIESADWIRTHLAPKIGVDNSADMVFSLDFPAVARDPAKKVLGLITRKLLPGEMRWDHLTTLCERARGYGYEIHNIVLGTGPTRADDLEGLREFDYPHMTLVDPDDLHQLTRAIAACDVIASTKFHGCVVATAYGIPAITLTTTDKFNSLYRMIEREDLIGHFINPDIAERLPKYIARVPRSTTRVLKDTAHAAMVDLRRQMLGELR